jgi:hypothetical protein
MLCRCDIFSKCVVRGVAVCAVLTALVTPSRELLASGHAPESHGSGHGGGHDGGHGGGHGEEPVAEVWDDSLGIKDRGVDLGEYHIKAYYPVQAQKSTVRFILHAKVPAERYQEIAEIVSTRINKLRDQVIIATRMTPLSLFDQPGLDSFRRRILMRLKRAVPELEIDDVLVSDFTLEVQSL